MVDGSMSTSHPDMVTRVRLRGCWGCCRGGEAHVGWGEKADSMWRGRGGTSVGSLWHEGEADELDEGSAKA